MVVSGLVIYKMRHIVCLRTLAVIVPFVCFNPVVSTVSLTWNREPCFGIQKLVSILVVVSLLLISKLLKQYRRRRLMSVIVTHSYSH